MAIENVSISFASDRLPDIGNPDESMFGYTSLGSFSLFNSEVEAKEAVRLY